jgi:hypothetical protein
MFLSVRWKFTSIVQNARSHDNTTNEPKPELQYAKQPFIFRTDMTLGFVGKKRAKTGYANFRRFGNRVIR